MQCGLQQFSCSIGIGIGIGIGTGTGMVDGLGVESESEHSHHADRQSPIARSHRLILYTELYCSTARGSVGTLGHFSSDLSEYIQCMRSHQVRT